MPYRIDIRHPPPNALDLLISLGALDVEPLPEGIAAILPDAVMHETVADRLGAASLIVSGAVARDDDSVWLLSQRPVRIGSILIASSESPPAPATLRLVDSGAFGTGHHPTTALCIEALEEVLAVEYLDSILDVGTGSGILALAALMLGVPQAVGLDIDAGALRGAAENARLNNFTDRLRLILGGPAAADGQWPLVIANVLAAPLIEMAPLLVRCLGKRGRLILSGISWSLESEVRRAYQRSGIRHTGSRTREGWTVWTGQASW